MPPTPFADRLAAALDRAGSPVCVGLDPVYERLPGGLRCGTGGLGGGTGVVAGIARFCEGVLEACRGVMGVVKPQAACFERYGSEGVACLKHVCDTARAMGYVVVLDAKRGDIGISAEHYAATAFEYFNADAVTLSGYLGADTLEPFLKDPARGVFVLVRTSNPGSDAVQAARLADGRSVAELMADEVSRLGAGRLGTCGLSSVGAVVGATKAADAAGLRARMPSSVFLVPGYGAQGGTAEDLRRMVIPGGRTAGSSGLLVTASRSVIYAFGAESTDWPARVAAAARTMSGEVRAVVG